MTENSPARVRLAPSPTGRFHIGNARTALYDYLFARQTGGEFVLRIEDTDRRRYVPEAEEELKEGLTWLGLEWDEGPDVGGPFAPYRQSERTSIYQEHAVELVDRGAAFYCFCSPERLSRVRKEQQQRKEPPKYDGLCRRLSPKEARGRKEAGESYVVRFKMPREGETIAVDHLRGSIRVENSTLDDFILLKSDGLPVYHLAAMVDDHLMEITHVLRGSEWLPTFPLHVRIYEAFGWTQPIWVHLSLFLNPSGKGKLSKRHAQNREKGAGAVFVLALKDLGYTPEAVVNWMALMGWSYDDRTEFFTMQDLVEKFSLENLKPSPAAVNFGKLDHFNGLHIRSLSREALIERIRPLFEAEGYAVDDEKMKAIAPLIQERIRTLDEAVDLAGFFFQDAIQPEAELLLGKKMTAAESFEAAYKAHAVIAGLDPYDTEPLERALRDLAEEMGLSAGQLFSILRNAVTGQPVSPPLIESMMVVGRETVLARVLQAQQALEALAQAE